MTSALSALAIRAKLTLTAVSPDPETMTSPSPARMEGAVASPTKCALRPICMNRIAAI